MVPRASYIQQSSEAYQVDDAMCVAFPVHDLSSFLGMVFLHRNRWHISSVSWTKLGLMDTSRPVLVGESDYTCFFAGV